MNSTYDGMSTIQLLQRFYGIPEQIFSGDPGSFGALGDSDFKRDELQKIFETIAGSDNDRIIFDCLSTVSFLLANSPALSRKAYEQRKTEGLIRREMLKLLIFSERTRKNETITLHNQKEKLILANYGDWIHERLLKPLFISSSMSSITTAEAKQELLSSKPKQGRTVSDPRLPALLWGTYGLLTELKGFKTPMPNILCDFLRQLMVLWDVLPDSPVIDTMWIRAQLRYLKAKEVKPTLEID